MKRRIFVLAAVAAPCVIFACGQGEVPIGPATTSAAGGFGQGGAGQGGGQGGGIFTGGGGPGECTSNADCGEGVCVEGSCCPSAEQACSSTCCPSGDVCLFDKCVSPGSECVSEADCKDDEYCEPALGEDMGQGGSGAGCTQPLVTGKCLPLPPVCTGQPSDPPDCIESCEYHPPVGQLNAVISWQWGYDPVPTEVPDKADVWSTPAIARINDGNCDGKVDLADPPNVVVVSGNVNNTFCCANGASNCRTGVLRMLDGQSGQEVWSLAAAEVSSQGFAGTSVALGDVDQDQNVDVVALTGEGKVAIVDAKGVVTHLSTDVVNGNGTTCFGWGGGVALGDMNNDGWTEIAFGASVFTMQGGTLSLLFHGTQGTGGGADRRLTHFVDLDGDGDLELLAGRTAYHHDGTTLWNNAANDGFTATGDFDADMLPEIVVVNGGQLRILEGATGALELGPITIPGTGTGGPPTVANFDGLPGIEIGVAKQNLYSVLSPDYVNGTINVVWSQSNHDASSSVTGSSVFDFEGDGKAEVIYNDECFVWVYDGANGNVLFTANTMSFTGTEATIVADVNGDGHAEIVMGSNAVNPNNWHCAHHTGSDSYPTWTPPANAPNYRGITVFADVANSWVGTRGLWNQHAYNVTNVCDPRDSACLVGSYYGEIPVNQIDNWQLSWLNNFRQNVQDGGIFDAPDAIVDLAALCTTPVAMTISVRNFGLAGLPAGVQVDIYRVGAPDQLIGTVYTEKALLPGQTEVIEFAAPTNLAGPDDTFFARIFVDPVAPKFRECREDNNDSEAVTPTCVQ